MLYKDYVKKIKMTLDKENEMMFHNTFENKDSFLGFIPHKMDYNNNYNHSTKENNKNNNNNNYNHNTGSNNNNYNHNTGNMKNKNNYNNFSQNGERIRQRRSKRANSVSLQTHQLKQQGNLGKKSRKKIENNRALSMSVNRSPLSKVEQRILIVGLR